MDKKYLAKIIARDSQGLKLISACCFKAKVRVNELKYLKKNQILLIFLQRFNNRTCDYCCCCTYCRKKI